MNNVLEFAMSLLDDDPSSYPAVMKEVIHIEALRSMSEVGLFEKMVFQGGTAIRLCHNGVRYSEDMDFSASESLTNLDLEEFFNHLQDMMADLGFQMEPYKPSKHKDFMGFGGPRRWSTRVLIPIPNKPDIRNSHFIKIEADDRKVIEPVTRPVRVKHDELGQYGPVVVTKSKKELMIDKVIALIDRDNIKWRDVFDIHQLNDSLASFDDSMMREKLSLRYKNKEVVERLTNHRLKDLSNPDSSRKFLIEMEPFLPPDLRKIWNNHELVRETCNDATNFIHRTTSLLSSIEWGKGF